MKVEYIDHMGTDLTVVNAARVSFDKESSWEENTITPRAPAKKVMKLKEADSKLISYLAKHNHFTPFTHCAVTMRWTVPIFMARQLFKHQVGLSINEISRRYVDSDPEFFMPGKWRGRHKSAKQGSSDEEIVWLDADESISVSSEVGQHYNNSIILYKEMLNAGVCPEQARMVLPQAMYTSYYWTGSLSAWARIYNLRNKPDAQKEHVILMTQLDEIMDQLFPVSWKVLTKST